MPLEKVVVEYVNADQVRAVPVDTVFVSSDDDPIKVIFLSENPKVQAVVELPVTDSAVADGGPFGSAGDDGVYRIQRRIEGIFVLNRESAMRLVERLVDTLRSYEEDDEAANPEEDEPP